MHKHGDKNQATKQTRSMPGKKQTGKKNTKKVLDTGIQTQQCKKDAAGGFKCTEKNDSHGTHKQ